MAALAVRRGILGRAERVGALAVVSFLCLADACWAVKAQIPPRDRAVFRRPAVRIAPVALPPTIDGIPDEACWRDAVKVRPFVLCYQAEYAPFVTEAALTYDEDTLYVAFWCYEPDAVRHPDYPYPPASAADTVEVLVDAGEEERYYKIAISPDGSVSVRQFGGGAKPWLKEPRVAQAKVSGSWRAEFAIPFAGTDLPKPSPAQPWRVNLGRRRANKVGNVAWAVTYAWFYEPQYFGDVLFGGSEALTAELAEVAPPRPGGNPLTLALTNRGDVPAECEVLLSLEEADGARILLEKHVAVGPGASVGETLSYDLPDGTLGIVTVEVREGRTADVLFRQSIPLNVPRNRAVLREASATLALLGRTSESMPGWFRHAVAGLEEECERLHGALSRRDMPIEEWRALEKPVERLLGQVKKLRWWQDTGRGEAAFAVGQANSMEKLLRNRAFTGPCADVVGLSAARGEYEGFQLVVVPATDLEAVSVTASPLAGPAGRAIPAEAVDVQWVDFVETRQPRHPIDYIGWFPDPLIPMSSARRTVSGDALHQPLWVTVHVPRGTPAGIYRGHIEVGAAGHEAHELTLRVQVRDFDLPKRPALQTVFWLNEGVIRDWYGWDALSREVRREYMAYLLKYRINPAMGTRLLEPRENLQFALERGLNTIQLGSVPSWPPSDDALARLTRDYTYLRDRDLLDMAYVYAHDEPDPSMYAEVHHAMAKVKEHFPGLNRVCTAFPPAKGLEGAVDTWVVTANTFNADAVAERQAAGESLWFYGGPTMKRPYTNWYVDYTGIEERMTFWHCWKYGATGLLHWSLNRWEPNMAPWSGDPAIDEAIAGGARWPEVPWNTWTYLNVNGEAQLVYPGQDGAFWSSVRLEIFRDGMEDYDYLAVLDRLQKRVAKSELHDRDALLAAGRELLAVGPPVASDLAEFTRDPNVLLRRRVVIAEHIERLAARLEAQETEAQ